METADTDLYLVFLRQHRKNGDAPEVVEHPIVRCDTYAEALKIRQRALRADQECVIRYVGPAGGGD